jgi:hypothetical protein
MRTGALWRSRRSMTAETVPVEVTNTVSKTARDASTS